MRYKFVLYDGPEWEPEAYYRVKTAEDKKAEESSRLISEREYNRLSERDNSMNYFL